MNSRTSARATIHTRIVEIDEIIPRPNLASEAQREDDDVQRLIPWPFLTMDALEETSNGRWPDDKEKFRGFFIDFEAHLMHLEDLKISDGLEYVDGGIVNAPMEKITVILPKKSWHVPETRKESMGTNTQSAMLCDLFHNIYGRIKDSLELGQGCQLVFRFAGLKLSYVIGGQRFSTITKGAVAIGSRSHPVPVIPFTGWFERQTWNDFLLDTLCVMFGQLAKSVDICGARTEDQEAFVVGFHGAYFYIARGYFTAEVISRVHLGGFSKDDMVELKFTRGYNFALKSDWLEATRALVRLLRYLLSGNAKIGVMRAASSRRKLAVLPE